MTLKHCSFSHSAPGQPRQNPTGGLVPFHALLFGPSPITGVYALLEGAHSVIAQATVVHPAQNGRHSAVRFIEQPGRHLQKPCCEVDEVFFKGSLRPFHRPYRTLPYISSSTAPTNSPRISASTRIRIGSTVTIWQTPCVAFKRLDEHICAKFDGITDHFWYFSMLLPTNQKVRHMLSMAKSSSSHTLVITSVQCPPD